MTRMAWNRLSAVLNLLGLVCSVAGGLLLFYSLTHLRRSDRTGIPDEGPDPQAEDAEKSSAQGQTGPDMGAALAGSGNKHQERPSSPDDGHDRGAAPERVVCSALALIR